MLPLNYCDFSPDFVISATGWGLLLSGIAGAPLGGGDGFFSVAAVSPLDGMLFMLGLFCGLRKLWAWANNPCLSLACWALNADPTFDVLSCVGAGGPGVLPWGRGGLGLAGIWPPGRCIGFGKVPWLGGTFGRKLVAFISICGLTTEAVQQTEKFISNTTHSIKNKYSIINFFLFLPPYIFILNKYQLLYFIFIYHQIINSNTCFILINITYCILYFIYHQIACVDHR